MRSPSVRWVRALVHAAILGPVLLLGGCGDRGASPDAAPHLAVGSDLCTTCGMSVQDVRFAAAVRNPGGRVLPYDSIECLIRALRDSGRGASGTIWLTDLPSGKLHAADSMTVVLAGYPSPMGKGYAAFLDPRAARAEAAARRGVAGPLAGFVDGSIPAAGGVR